MRIAASTLIYLESDYKSALTNLAELGFEEIELFGDLPNIDVGAADQQDRKWLTNFSESHGISLSMHCPCWDLNPASANRWHRDQVVEQYSDAIKFCSDIGASTMIFHCGTKSDPKLSRSDALQFSADTLSRCLPEAERSKVVLAVENVGYGALCMLDEPGDLVQIVDSVRSSFARIAFDVGHGVLEGFDMTESVRTFGRRLAHLHLHSNDGKSDSHLPCDEGVVDFPALGKALVENGFDGVASIEVYSVGNKREAMERSRSRFESVTGVRSTP